MKLALIGLACCSALVLAGTLLAPADYGREPVLAAAINDGKMEEFLASDDERRALLVWVAAGAPESAWKDVSPILAARCTSCHHSDASFDMLRLDRYGPTARSAIVRSRLEEKVTGGSMGKYLETDRNQRALTTWIDRGAPESGWTEVEPMLNAHCVQCHHPEGVQGIVPLSSYRAVSRLAMAPTPSPRPVWPPAIVLALATGAGLFLRARRVVQ